MRDLPHTKFPRIKGMLTDDFRRQVGFLSAAYEMASLESVLAFLSGEYQPRRDLCLLTFDDCLKDHFTDVWPVLSERQIQGLFFLPTACLEEESVAAVHKSHFLMAALDLQEYRCAFLRALTERSPETQMNAEWDKARMTYRWDDPEVAAFKYFLNFQISADLRDSIVDTLFASHFGDEAAFARQLYITWDEARQMQSRGMLMGGHSHNHIALATMDDRSQQADLETCAGLLRRRLESQSLWPFSYPYGKAEAFNVLTLHTIQKLGFYCSFATEVGSNEPRRDLFCLRRIDPKDVVRIN